MRKVFFTLLILCGFVVVKEDRAFCATKKTSRASGRSSRSVSVKNISGKVQSNKFSGTVREAYKVDASSKMSCGVPADVTNASAKRLCALAMADALKVYCKSYSCQSKLKVELSFNFDLSALSGVSADVDGARCSGKNLSTFCAAFQSELLDGLWDLYSESSVRDRKNCNMAMAKYSAAQDCFQYIEAEKNQSVGGIFSASKISDLDKGIDERCGRDAILKKYKTIALDDLSTEDMNTYFGMGKISSDGTVAFDSDGFQGKKKLSSTVASLFANVGDNTWNYVGQIGKLADLKLNMKSNTYPRELVTIANTFVTEGETACGKSFTSDMEDTSFELVDNRSSLERAVAKKGILKGVFDFVVDNTVALVSEDKAERLKKSGLLDKSGKNLYPQADRDEKILNSCSGDVDTVTNNVKSVLENLDKAVAELEKYIENKTELLKKSENKKIITNLKKILVYAMNKRPDDLPNLIEIPAVSDLRDTVNKLKTVDQFNCEGNGFETAIDVKYDFDYTDGDIDAIVEALLRSKDNFISEKSKIEGKGAEEESSFGKYFELMEKMAKDGPKKP